jgi:hypothetical protein
MENLDNVLYPNMTEKQQKIFEKNWIKNWAESLEENCEMTKKDALEAAKWDFVKWENQEGWLSNW